jgi:ribosomal protein L37AE/L43A
MLARLASALARLATAELVPDCPACGTPMALRREEAVGAFVMEQVYACGRCGRQVTRVQPWAIPD